MLTYRAFDEVIDFIASIPKPAQVLAYEPSQAAQQHLEALLDKKRNGQISIEESHELDQHLMVEHLMRMAKKKAKSQLSE